MFQTIQGWINWIYPQSSGQPLTADSPALTSLIQNAHTLNGIGLSSESLLTPSKFENELSNFSTVNFKGTLLDDLLEIDKITPIQPLKVDLKKIDPQEFLCKSAQKITLTPQQYDEIYDPLIEELTAQINALKKLKFSGSNSEPNDLVLSFLTAIHEEAIIPQVIDFSDTPEESGSGFWDDTCINTTEQQLNYPQKKSVPPPPPMAPHLIPSRTLSLTVPTQQAFSSLQDQLKEHIKKISPAGTEGNQLPKEKLLTQKLFEFETEIHKKIKRYETSPPFLCSFISFIKKVYTEIKDNTDFTESINFSDWQMIQGASLVKNKLSEFVEMFRGDANAQAALLQILVNSLEQLKRPTKPLRIIDPEFQKRQQKAEKKTITKTIEEQKRKWLLELPPKAQIENELNRIKRTELCYTIKEISAIKALFSLNTVEDLSQVIDSYEKFVEEVSSADSITKMKSLQSRRLFWITHFIDNFPRGVNRQRFTS